LNNLERKKGKEENIEECDGSSNNEDGDAGIKHGILYLNHQMYHLLLPPWR
jgi:hypothetical protein